MGFLDRLRGKQTAQAPVTWPPMVLVPTGLDPMSEGRSKFMRGFYIRDASTDRGISYDELSELVPGAVVFNVAGTSHRQDALQGPSFAPGEPVKLIPEPKIHLTATQSQCGTQTAERTSAMFPQTLRPQSAAYCAAVNRSALPCSLSFFRTSDGWP